MAGFQETLCRLAIFDPATENNNYRDWAQQNSPAFFKTYTSNPTNMGPYYIDGVKETFAEFMQR